MNKIVIALLFAFLLFSGFDDSQVWVRAKMPQNVNAGGRFTIEININKLDLQNFAEFSQTLPAGFKAVPKNSGSANFSFKNQVVKFTWFRLPRTAIINLSYEVIVDESVYGTQSLPAKFTYIYLNQRGVAELTKDKINVVSKNTRLPKDEPTVPVDIHFPPKDPLQVQCLRPLPVYNEKLNYYTIRLWVSLGNIEGNARIKESIPAGYIATMIDGKGAAFSSENNTLQFFWTRLPSEKNFEISYKLSGVTKRGGSPSVSGNMIYLQNGKYVSVPVYQVSTK